jgi:2-polyprenyl-3-methyl-5-hydroxy-6-metoxy-1,4-benzoquinol methylase
VEDKGYQKFVQPIVAIVLTNFNKKHVGLDFGCGPGPVISKLLRDQEYQITTYDPIFDANIAALKTTYDYIVCCEVIEHFHNPVKEFKLLKSLLKPNGKLICKTDLYSEAIDFKKWYYKNDQTHVIFYHKKTFNWIQQHIGFSKISISNRIITLEA